MTEELYNRKKIQKLSKQFDELHSNSHTSKFQYEMLLKKFISNERKLSNFWIYWLMRGIICLMVEKRESGISCLIKVVKQNKHFLGDCTNNIIKSGVLNHTFAFEKYNPKMLIIKNNPLNYYKSSESSDSINESFKHTIFTMCNVLNSDCIDISMAFSLSVELCKLLTDNTKRSKPFICNILYGLLIYSIPNEYRDKEADIKTFSEFGMKIAPDFPYMYELVHFSTLLDRSFIYKRVLGIESSSNTTKISIDKWLNTIVCSFYSSSYSIFDLIKFARNEFGAHVPKGNLNNREINFLTFTEKETLFKYIIDISDFVVSTILFSNQYNFFCSSNNFSNEVVDSLKEKYQSEATVLIRNYTDKGNSINEYISGKRVRNDVKLDIYRQMANQNNPVAQYKYGMHLIKKNEKEGLDYIKKSAKQGAIIAQLDLISVLHKRWKSEKENDELLWEIFWYLITLILQNEKFFASNFMVNLLFEILDFRNF